MKVYINSWYNGFFKRRKVEIKPNPKVILTGKGT